MLHTLVIYKVSDRHPSRYAKSQTWQLALEFSKPLGWGQAPVGLRDKGSGRSAPQPDHPDGQRPGLSLGPLRHLMGCTTFHTLLPLSGPRFSCPPNMGVVLNPTPANEQLQSTYCAPGTVRNTEMLQTPNLSPQDTYILMGGLGQVYRPVITNYYVELKEVNVSRDRSPMFSGCRGRSKPSRWGCAQGLQRGSATFERSHSSELGHLPGPVWTGVSRPGPSHTYGFGIHKEESWTPATVTSSLSDSDM